MIQIQKSPTADTRTCDFANTSKETLLASLAFTDKQDLVDQLPLVFSVELI